jgi:hypothetical protein
MRIFLHEHVTGGGLLGGVLPASLEAEGRAMLAAVGTDLAALPGVRVVSTVDARLTAPAAWPDWELVRVASAPELERVFDALAAACDGVLLIAPELDGVLASLARRVEALGGRLLGPSAAAIEMACDKLHLAGRLARAGVPAVPASPLDGGDRPHPERPLVVKPRRGAGSTGVRLWRHGEAAPVVATESIVTPYVPGLPASVLCIAGREAVLPLRAGEQLLSADGSFRYLGGRIPLPPALEQRAVDLARRALAAIPGLLGFAGVDLVLGEEGDVVVEVNARLTTSYVGLRVLAADNLAASWLGAVTGGEPTAPRWKDARVRFGADGTVQDEAM